MNQFKYRNKKYLSKEYLEKRRKVYEIAKENNVSKKTIYVWLKKLKIPTITEIDRIDKEWLYEQYIIKRRMSTDIAKELGCRYQKILDTLRKYNIPVRTTGESLKGRKVAKEVRKKMGRSGKESASWKNNWNDLGYCQRHRRIKNIKKTTNQCEKCGKSIKKLELSNKDYKYSEDPNTWEYLCKSCHRKKDYLYHIYHIILDYFKLKDLSLDKDDFFDFLKERIKEKRRNFMSNTTIPRNT